MESHSYINEEEDRNDYQISLQFSSDHQIEQFAFNFFVKYNQKENILK